MHLFKSLLQRDYWHEESGIGPNITPERLGGYYRDLRKKTEMSGKVVSDLGVPLAKVQGKFMLQPVTVCQVALGWHERWIEDVSSDQALNRFLLLANWLVENSEDRNMLGRVWPMQYGIATYSLSPGWISALVQGQAVSVLVRAYQITKRDVYLQTAQGALRPFMVNKHFGGVVSEGEDGTIFFEEYPSLEKNHVLNGFISSLWGLYDYYLAINDESIKNLFLKGVTSLLNSINLFDTGFWSRYSLLKHRNISNLASPYYHKAHISQLIATNYLYKSPIFLEFANKWEQYLKNRKNLYRVIFEKGISRIFFVYNEKKTYF